MKTRRLPYWFLRLRWLIVITIFVSYASLLAGCSSDAAMYDHLAMAPMSGMPETVQTAPAAVQQAYQFAAANPDAVKNVPCYCGCDSIGHTSNYDCYVKEAKPSGETAFDLHAVGCGVCVDITQDVMKMTAKGLSPQAIRTAIDENYSQYGSPTISTLQ